MTRDLPAGWTSASLADLCDPEAPICYGVVQPEATCPGGARLIRVCDIQGGEIDIERLRTISHEVDQNYRRSRVQDGDVLVTVVGTIGRVALVPAALSGANIARAVARVRLQRAVSPAWGRAVLQSGDIQTELQQEAREVARKTLNISTLEQVRVPVPPLNEQRRIVAKLEDLLARSRRAKDALDAIPPLLEKLRQSILAVAFRGDLTADWRAKNPDVEPAEELLKRIRIERRKKWEEAELAKLLAKGKAPADDRWKAKYKEPEPVDASELPELPEGWCWASLSSLSDAQRDIPYGIVQTGDESEGGVPTVRCGDIKGFSIDAGKLKRVSPEIEREYARTRLVGGEVLIAIRGTVGQAVVVPPSLRDANISREVAMIPVLPGADSELVMYALSSPEAQARLLKHVKGVAQSGINLSDLRSLPIPLPPATEQVAAAAAIRAALRSCGALQERLRYIGNLRASLEPAVLAKAFSGELVDQDPNDEPASALLERLAAELKAAQEAPAQARRSPRQKVRS
jgi:type I restriction enzyme, S subunit